MITHRMQIYIVRAQVQVSLVAEQQEDWMTGLISFY